ncbi:MAG: zinc-ribbon family [Acidobacteriota bacterium]|jgi:transcription elongation factor Elf1|nr:zinc-ribbon family [Acidobacteriota bacterium]
MIIIGTRFFTWGSTPSPQQTRCGNCGAVTNFIIKKGMRFITLFFFIPVCPISGLKHIAQCPNCGTRYQAA